ncbi:hypothetical protein GJV06_21855 [Enterobacteriaceae bacterium RIT691]|nr:hypothetical protein [Enterobacteriaceae bacterium RIT691]
MGLKQQIMQNIAASRQTSEMPSGCKACHRKGLPILPLRVSAVPQRVVSSFWQPEVPPQDVALSGGEYKYALRTLRAGYLYVLLDKTIWQGYQVMKEGYLRQFNPLVMPEDQRIASLGEECLAQEHDIPASFINIDDDKYSEAWLAFSSDPWSQTVLREYASGQRSAARFTKISLSALRADPDKIPEGLALEPSLLTLQTQVVEYATSHFPDLERVTEEPGGGAHGFYSRTERGAALSSYIAQLTAQYGCKPGAIAVNDLTGVVQELNAGRLQIARSRQAYLTEPAIKHQHLISDAIENYLLELQKKVAHVIPVAGAGMAHFTRLQTCYNEPARAEFAQVYQRKREEYQQRISAVGRDLAAWYQSAKWLTECQQDYAVEGCPMSWIFQLRTLNACIEGGCQDEATEAAWLAWLQNEKGLVFEGLLTPSGVMQKSVREGDRRSEWLAAQSFRIDVIQRAQILREVVGKLLTGLTPSVQERVMRAMQRAIGLITDPHMVQISPDTGLEAFMANYQTLLKTNFDDIACIPEPQTDIPLPVVRISSAMLVENTPNVAFEVWLRCCCFGIAIKRKSNDPVWHVSSPEDLDKALAAYNAIMNDTATV